MIGEVWSLNIYLFGEINRKGEMIFMDFASFCITIVMITFVFITSLTLSNVFIRISNKNKDVDIDDVIFVAFMINTLGFGMCLGMLFG